MRIGIIAHLKHALAEPFAGGLEMFTFLLATKLRMRGHDVTVYAAKGSSATIGAEMVCGETAVYSDSEEFDEFAFYREHVAYLSIMRRLQSSRFDVIHNNSLHYLPILMANALPIPVLTTLHTPPFEPLARSVRAARALNLVAVSNAIRAEWAPTRFVQDAILNGVDLSRFMFSPFPDARRYAVWHGRIVPEKGLHYAIDAARLVGLTLRFAGPIANVVYFNEQIAPRLGADTLYAGHLKHDDLGELIGGASVALSTPCWEEPYGLVVAEALACGVPVAAFARGAIPSILDFSSGVLAEPDNVRSLASAVVSAMTLKRRDCRHRAESYCDVELMVDSYETTYRSLLGRFSNEIRATFSSDTI